MGSEKSYEARVQQATSKKIADLNTLLDLAEAALYSINNFSVDRKRIFTNEVKILKAGSISGEALAAIKAGRKMIEVE